MTDDDVGLRVHEVDRAYGFNKLDFSDEFLLAVPDFDQPLSITSDQKTFLHHGICACDADVMFISPLVFEPHQLVGIVIPVEQL